MPEKTIKLPRLSDVVKLATDWILPGGRVGVLDWMWARPPEGRKELFMVTVTTGREARSRCFVGWQK